MKVGDLAVASTLEKYTWTYWLVVISCILVGMSIGTNIDRWIVICKGEMKMSTERNLMQDKNFLELVKALEQSKGFCLGVSMLGDGGRLTHTIYYEDFPRADVLSCVVEIRELAIKDLEKARHDPQIIPLSKDRLAPPTTPPTIDKTRRNIIGPTNKNNGD
jgi:hypothetical protein